MAENGASDKILKEADRYSIQGQAREGVYAMGAAGMATGGFGGLLLQISGLADEIRPWNALYPNWRDGQLRWLAKNEPMLASGLYSMKTRIAGLNWVVNDSRPRIKKYTQDLFNNCQYGQGLRVFLMRAIDDLLSTDNGLFVELWGKGRPDRPLKGGLLGFAHMDSRQCWRTFDPEFPVIYYNPQRGEYHKMHHTRVLTLSDNEQPIELARGIGFCAVSRALRFAQIMRNTLIYREEKISGRFTRAIGAASGVTRKQLDEALRASDEDATARGFVMYKGIPILVSPGLGDSGEQINIALTDLASVPDGFDISTETTLYAYALAFAFGVDAREFWPATASGATKADASVQNMKARGRGIGMNIEVMQDLLRKIAPEGVEVEADYTDDEQDQMQAAIHKVRTETYALAVDKGAINAMQMQASMVADGILDPLVLEEAPSMPVSGTDNDALVEDEINEGIQEPQASDVPSADTEEEENEPDETEPTVKKKAVDLRPASEPYAIETNRFSKRLQATVARFIRQLPDNPSAARILLDVADLQGNLKAELSRGLTEAFGIGLAGKQPTDEGRAKLQAFYESQLDYLQGFMDDLESDLLANVAAGVVGDDLKAATAPAESRAALYAGAYWASVYQGMGDNLNQRRQKPRVRRMLDVHADHCQDCIARAREYDNFDDMLQQAGIPGDGSTACLSNCRCMVEVELGRRYSGVWGRLTDDPTVFRTSLLRG